MAYRNLLLLLVVVSLGCSGGDKPSPTANAGASGAKPNDPIASVAHEFMNAVFKNDLVNVTKCLTPKANQCMQAQDLRFGWGSGEAKLEIGEVRKLSDSQAAVVFLVTDPTDGDVPQELACLMRHVQGNWRVYGLSCDIPGGSPEVRNFENLPQTPPGQPAAPVDGNRYVENPAPPIPNTTAPPQTAAGQPGGVVR